VPFILPTPQRIAHLSKINALLRDHRDKGDVDALAKAVQEMVGDPAFRQTIAASPALAQPIITEDDLMRMAEGYLYHHLYRRDLISAALTLWDSETFTPLPHCVQLVWQALFTKRMIALIGGGGLGKTYSPSAYFLLEWLLDPEWTRFQVASASEDHLKKNLYADIVRLHQGSSLPLPGLLDAESISLNKKTGMGIFTLVLPGGPEAKGKIKGAHTKPRPQHSIFGRRSRVFSIVDEAQEVPQNIFKEIPNRFTTVVPGDVDHLKFVVCANPKDRYSEFGQICKPPGGWDSITFADDVWESEEGWAVVSLNGMAHENVVQRRVVFPGMVTRDGVDLWLRRCHGDDQHPDMWTYVYGKFPPEGSMKSIVKGEWLRRCEGEWVFDRTEGVFAASDPAFEGDLATLATGRVGRAIAWEDYAGVRHELPQPKMALQIDAVNILPRGDTQELADEIMGRIKLLGVLPEHYAQDKTGNAIGVHDVIRRQWGQKVSALKEGDVIAPIMGIHYAEGPSETKISEEDTETPKEQFDRVHSELWFAAGRFFEFDCVKMGKSVPPRVFEELGARHGGRPTGKGKKQSVESKKEYKLRTGLSSPDHADAVTLLIHVARLTTPGLVAKAKDTPVEPPAKWPPWGDVDVKETAFDMSGFDVPDHLAKGPD